MQFESEAAPVFEKADCTFRVELHNLGPGRATGLQLRLSIFHAEKHQNRLLSEAVFDLDDVPEGVRRTEILPLKSHIRENARIQVELIGDGIPTQVFELSLDYTKVKVYH